MKRLILIAILACKSFLVHAQCPSLPDPVTDLADGGNFSGPCVINIGSSITITGIVNWNGGTLHLNGSSGNLALNPGSQFNIFAGAVYANDLGNGQIRVQEGAQLNIAAGASATSATSLIIGGTVNIAGSLTSESGQLSINASSTGAGQVTVSGNGTLFTGSTGDNTIQRNGTHVGSLTLTGNATVTFNGDLEINGGTAVVQGGTLYIGDVSSADGASADLNVYNGGILQINAGATVNVEDDIVNSTDTYPATTPPPTLTTAGIFHVNGALNGGGRVYIYDSESTDSELTGTGSITVDGTFTDNECNQYVTLTNVFCGCTGLGTTCIGHALPIILDRFTGQQRQNTIQLEWQTASEINNAYFIVQRLESVSAFIDIAEVSGHGTSLEAHQYSAIDHAPRVGENLYRLKQIDYDGTETFSELVKVIFSGSENSFECYPNPTRDGKIHVVSRGHQPNEMVKCEVRTMQDAVIMRMNIQADEKGFAEQIIETTSRGIHIISFGTHKLKVLLL